MTDLTPTDLHAIKAKALSMAETADWFAERGDGYTRECYERRARTLRGIASDAQAAIDGCPASLESVIEFAADEHLLDLAVHEARACEQSTIGMAA